jgi:cytochrome d ubiquinol oxidase subunit I
MNVVMLSRIQFALTIMFHYLFPPLTIGMGVVLVFLEGRYLWTRDRMYHTAARFWTEIFALNFAMGVATGIVMEFQFGTNWATYSRFVGDVFGSALAAEGIFAFFLESGFLAVLVFGWEKVGPKMHFFSTCMVAFGSIFSSVWIVIANSWQQTPAGYHVVQMVRNGKPWFIDGRPVMRAEVTDFWAVVFNHSTLERLPHVLLGCFIVGSFFVISISAWYILKFRHTDFARRSFTGGLLLATFSSLAIMVNGHSQARNVYRTQPAKLAAFEGNFRTGRGDETLFGIPHPDEERVDWKIRIPGGLSFLLFDNFSKTVIGLDQFAPEDRPPVLIPFITWRLMVGIGSFLLGLTLLGCVLLWKGSLFHRRPLMWIFVFSVLAAVVANEAGWVSAEVGRQPWTVYPPVPWTGEPGQSPLALGSDGHVHYDEVKGLRTINSVSTVVSSDQVVGSILGFGAIYFVLFLFWIMVLTRKIHRGPIEHMNSGHDDDGLHGFLDTASERPDHEQSLTDTSASARPIVAP